MPRFAAQSRAWHGAVRWPRPTPPQSANARKWAALTRQELADPGRPAPQWSITAGTSSRLGAGPAVHGALPPTVIDQHGAPSAGSVPKAEAGSVPKAEAGSVVDGHTRSVSDSATTDDTRAMTAGELSGEEASAVACGRGGRRRTARRPGGGPEQRREPPGSAGSG